MTMPRARDDRQVSASWRVIAGPCPLSNEGMQAVAAALRRGEEAGCVLTSAAPDTVLGPREVALEIARALDAGERVLLANGPWQQGSTLGDPYIARAISLLPSDLPPGVVVGGFHHAHALTELALRSPAVQTYAAPPIAESLAANDGGHMAHAAFRTIGLLGSTCEQLFQLPRRSHVGYSRPATRRRPVTLPACRDVTSRTLRAGKAQGPILAGNLLPVSFAIGRWRDVLDRAILAIEIAGAQMRMIDRYLQRLALLGIFDRIGALLVGVPFDLVSETPSLQVDEIIARAVGRSPCVTVANAFVGSGVPGTYLRLMGRATVCARPEGLTITPNAEGSTALAVSSPALSVNRS
jgi:hypothetical protein